MKVAIIGSREFVMINRFAKRMVELLEEYPNNLYLISGGAKGIDTKAEKFARAKGIPIEIIRPIDPKSKIDYLFRNVEIITKADFVIAFWNGSSKGTKFCIDYCKARGKEIEVVNI